MWYCISRHVNVFITPSIRSTFPSTTSGIHRLPRFSTQLHVKWSSNLRQPHHVTVSDAQKKTIYALSTPPGKAGVGVIRVSGPDALKVWKATVRPSKSRATNANPEPWKLHRCHICHPEKEEVLDDGLAVFFKSPNSFTTEDVLELHIHSGRAVTSSILSALSSLPYCRAAEPGEFTRRAFEGGRLDLTQVEGLKDLIEAETDSQRRIALNAARGTTRSHFEHLRSEIIHCLAMVEALIDFGEGEDIEEGVFEQAKSKAFKLNETIQGHLNDRRRGEIIRSGIRLAIFGPPNAGKSSLLNFLAQREAAIVTPVPGTTRDILELSLDIGGLPVIVADTAGVRMTDDLVENIGIERARNMVEGSDISLCVLSLPDVYKKTLDGYVAHIPPTLKPLLKPDTCFLLNKSDLSVEVSEEEIRRVLGGPFWITSLSTGTGTSGFLEGFSSVLKDRYELHDDASSQTTLITHARHRAHLESASRFLEAFLDHSAEDVVLGAEELRYAAQAVGKISGLIDTEDVLDALFRDFCIGK